MDGLTIDGGYLLEAQRMHAELEHRARGQPLAVEIDIKPVRDKRTLDQNRLMWALLNRQALGELEQRAGVTVTAHLSTPILPDQGQHGLLPGNTLVGIALGGHVHQLAVDVGAGDLTHAKLAKPADGNFHFVAVAPAGPVFDGRFFFRPERLCYLAERIALFSADGCLNNRGINFGLNLSECATIEVAFFAVDNTAALHQPSGRFATLGIVQQPPYRYTLTSLPGGGTIRLLGRLFHLWAS